MQKIRENRARIRAFIPEILFIIIGIGLLVRLFRLCLTSASDFEVYWYAIHAWVAGHSPYSQYSTVFNGLVFKYPPWILPVFLPFAWLSLEASKAIWLIGEAAIIGYCIKWLISKGVHHRVAALVALMFWWMWLAHAYFGQIMVFLMAFALYACDRFKTDKADKPNQRIHPEPWVAAVAFLFTAKIFSMVSLLGIGKKIFQFKTILYGLGLLFISHFILLITHPHFSLGSAIPLLQSLYGEWVHAAASGGAELGAKIVRGQQNHGFVAAILRSLQVEATHVHFDILIAAILAVIFSFLWHRFSKRLKFEEQWAGWLALGVIIHPLAWHHSFTMAFPLCAFTLQRAMDSKKRVAILSALLGTCCIGIFIPQVIGVTAVIPLEFIGIKAWGVLISGMTLAALSQEELT